MGDRVRICAVDEVLAGTARAFDVRGRRLALVRIGDDFYAIADRCSHADFSLSEGEVDPDDKTLECPKHGSTFSLVTGDPQTFPATMPVQVYTIESDGSDVYLVLP